MTPDFIRLKSELLLSSYLIQQQKLTLHIPEPQCWKELVNVAGGAQPVSHENGRTQGYTYANNSVHWVFSTAKEKTRMACLDAAIKL